MNDDRSDRGVRTRRAGIARLGAAFVLTCLLAAGAAGCGQISLSPTSPQVEDGVTTTNVSAATGEAGGEADGETAQLLQAELEADAEHPAKFISLCATCHDRLDRELDWRRERKLVFNHPAHFAEGIRCAACHQEFPHKPGRIVYVSVETCFVCHGTVHGQQGSLASTACDTCHTADIAPVTPDHSEATWVKLAGDGLGMHSADAKTKRLFCKMCHEQSYCDSCHRMAIPHPDEWVPAAHQESAKSEREACSMCHDQGVKFCNDCHHVEYERLQDWTAQHRTVARSLGAESCYECHVPPFCSECHVRTGKQRGVLGG
ncbi:MAG: hypothetical protein KKA32_10865 [Actinobacteria bacterium]|nr:hypothetical protein [Actinomycetota bacterium]